MDHKNTQLNSSSSGVKVHPNAFVDPSAELHDGVIISQGAIVGPDVTIGKGTEIGPNAVISGRKSYLAGRMEKNYFARSSSPTKGLI